MCGLVSGHTSVTGVKGLRIQREYRKQASYCWRTDL
jgi:hypothetical protein